MRRIISTALAVLLAFSPTVASAWTATGGGNHEGADWVITSDTDVGGRHFNVGRFVVQSGKTATVQTRTAAGATIAGDSGTMGVSTEDATAMVVLSTGSLAAANGKYVEIYDADDVLVLAGWAKLGPGMTLGSDLVYNGTFETGVSEWEPQNNAVISQEAGGESGYCLKLLEGGQASPSVVDFSRPGDSGALYQFSLSRKEGNTPSVWWSFWIFTADTGVYRDGPSGSNWEQSSIFMHMKSTIIGLNFGTYAAAGSGEYVLFDNVTLRKVLTPGTTDLEIYKDSTFTERGCALTGDGNVNDIDRLVYIDSPVNFEVHARDISIEGAVNADGKGYTGGAGGAGVYASYCGAGACNSCTGSLRSGGQGSSGTGPWPGSAGLPGGNAGYLSAAGNGDTTTTDFLSLGSGGGGGRAGNSCTPNCNYECPTECGCCFESNCNHCRGGRGGGNAHGGGAVMLVASSSLRVSGSITTKGTDAAPGGNGESDTCGYGQKGYASGAGAGGGILLRCSGTGGIKVTGTVDTRGGNANTTNYGSLKVFALPGRVDFTGSNIYSGHEGSGGYGWPLLSETLASPFFIF